MVWKTLAESLESALASMVNEVGEGAIAVASDAVKSSKRGPDAETPGQVQGRNNSREEAEGSPVKGHHSASRAHMDTALPMGRRMTVATASPKAVGSPARAAVIRLVIDNGDRPERREEQLSGRSIARLPGGASRSKLKLVV